MLCLAKKVLERIMPCMLYLTYKEAERFRNRLALVSLKCSKSTFVNSGDNK